MFVTAALALAVTFACVAGLPENVPAARPLAGVTVAVTQPADGTAVGLGARFTVNASAQSTISHLSHFTFYVNGASIGTGPLHLTNPYLGYSSITWSPSSAGWYFLQAQITLANGSTALSDPVRVCVFSIGLNTTEGYEGGCDVPTRVPSAPSTGSVHLSAFASPTQLIFYAPGSSCANNLQLTFVAQVDDVADSVGLVALAVNVQGLATQYLMNWTTTRPIGQKEYRYTVNLSRSYQGVTSPSPTISWIITALDRHGTELDTTNGTVSVLQSVCAHEQIATTAPLQIIPSNTPTDTIVPSPTDTSAPTITFTPASALDCPSGTYFADATHTCIPIATPTTGKGGTPVCSNITSDSVCNSTAGCSFNYGTKKCQKK